MLVILYYLFLAELSYKFVDAELMECMVLSGGGGGGGGGEYCHRKASNCYVLQQQPHIL